MYEESMIMCISRRNTPTQLHTENAIFINKHFQAILKHEKNDFY